MINEWEEFCAYTGTVSYTASKKSDTTWLGRFTFATILEFEGMSRILTVLARGYLFHGEDGAVISGDPHDRVDHARRALCAWCSVPEDGKRVQDKEWQFQPTPSASTSSGNSVCNSEKSVRNCHSLSGTRFPSSGTLHQAQSARRA